MINTFNTSPLSLPLLPLGLPVSLSLSPTSLSVFNDNLDVKIASSWC